MKGKQLQTYGQNKYKHTHLYTTLSRLHVSPISAGGGGISSKGFSVVGRGLVGVGGVGNSWVGLETLKFCLTTFNKDF